MHAGVSRRTFLKAAGGSIAMSGVAGCVGGGSGIPQLNVGIVDPPGEPVLLMENEDIQDAVAENIGSEYELDVDVIGSTPDIINSLAADEVQMGNVAYASFPAAINQEAVPGGMTAVLAELGDAHEDFFAFPMLALSDSGISGIDDLEGALLGVNAVGTGVHAIGAVGLERNGLDPNEDVEWVEIEFPAMGSALREGRIDAGIFVPIFQAAEELEGGVETVFTSRDVWDGVYDFAFQAARNDFIDENGDALRAFLEDYVSMLDYLYDEGNRDEFIPIVSEVLDLPEELLDEYYFTEADYYRPPDGRFDHGRLQDVIDRLVETPFLDEGIDVDEHVTNEYLP